MIKKYLTMIFLAALTLILLGGCGMGHKDKSSHKNKTETAKEAALTAPTKETVLEQRVIALAGMKEEDIERLNTIIENANLRLEREFLYGDIEKQLSDPDSEYWNYLEQTGEIVVGYAFSPEDYEKRNSLGLSKKEFNEQYGEKITDHNEYDAGKICEILTDLKSKIRNKDFIQDFENLTDDVKKAKETHDVKYVVNAYHILHDMDYYLLRYGPEDVGKYVKDKSTIDIYYGTLTCYK